MKNDDAQRIERILAGDEAAFTALVKKYEKQIHVFVWRRVRDYHVAEEITQDTFLRAYEKLGTLRNPNRFSGWLYMIATRCFLTWLGQKRIQMQSLEAMSEAEVEALFYAQYMAEQTEKLATEKQRQVVAYLLQKLPARERTAVVLHYLSEMTCEEIGDFLEVSPNTVKSQLHRARKRLKGEESMVRETLGNFQNSDDLIDDIIKWTQVNEPGVAGSVGTLSATSENTLYVVVEDESIYKLPMGEEAWQLVNTDFLRQNTRGEIPIAERDGILYIIPSHELFASTDGGVTWEFVGPCPKGYTRELLITEDAFYLCLGHGIFRSDDAGSSWEAMNDGLDSRLADHSGVHSLRINQDTLFVMTDIGPYRLDEGRWKYLQLPVDDMVHVGSLAVYEDQIYVAASVNFLRFYGASEGIWEQLWKGEKRSWWIFRSIDGGDSWTDVTPMNAWNLTGLRPDITLIATEKVLLAMGKEDGTMVRSMDRGDTWTPLQSTGISATWGSVRKTLVLDENTLYTAGNSGVHRSTDSGKTWHRFNTRLESRVDNLVGFMRNQVQGISTVLYARVGREITKSVDRIGGDVVKSTDGGVSWNAVDVEMVLSHGRYRETTLEVTQIADTDNVLYAKVKRRKSEVLIFRLSDDDSALTCAEGGPPSFHSRELFDHTLRGTRGKTPVFEMDSLTGRPLFENPVFGADLFFERLGQIDARLAYEMVQAGLSGSFTVSYETFYMEYNYKLFRWKPGDSEWHDTGVEETGELSRDNIWRGFKIAASDETVYVGKRDGHLLQSLDGGDNWNDITSSLPLSVEHFNQIVFADSTVHVATDKGVFNSKDGVTWCLLTNEAEASVILKSLATIGDSVYGANDEGIYRLQSDTDTWEQVAPEISGVVTSLVVDENMFYVGTERQGVLGFKRTE
ncbi:MAG: sigma-70 family RNA polymerase sigma factor [Candidatus Poribacteria bacterium]|nr:sigma-70 family RNA polymerase sigma factor [Candidatus Poribacteria bacterium]